MILPVSSPSVITPSSLVLKIKFAGEDPVVDLISKLDNGLEVLIPIKGSGLDDDI